jgi:hypothetical protein
MGIKITKQSEGERLLRQCKEAIERSIAGINRSVSGLEHLQRLEVYKVFDLKTGNQNDG